MEIPDTIEMRRTEEAYELVLLPREQVGSWPVLTRDKGLVLFKLPYEFFSWLQGDPWESHRKARELLVGAGLTYHSNPEVSSAWDYRNQYGSFRWWHV